MLHRHFLIYVLMLIFGLGQFGLITHDVTHINQALTLADLEQSHQAAWDLADIAPQKIALTHLPQRTKSITETQQKHLPVDVDQHNCEKCVGFNDLSDALQAAGAWVVHAKTRLEALHEFEAIHVERFTVHGFARAPPHDLA